MLSGITVLPTLARIPSPTVVNHATVLEIAAVPAWEKADIRVLQVADSHLGAFLRYWRRGRPPTTIERAGEPKEVLELVRQWRRIKERDLFTTRKD